MHRSVKMLMNAMANVSIWCHAVLVLETSKWSTELLYKLIC
jgi:hypothetical protein